MNWQPDARKSPKNFSAFSTEGGHRLVPQLLFIL